MKKFSLRINGTRVGEAARPVESCVERLPTRRVLVPMRNAAALVRDYRDGTDDGGDIGGGGEVA